uniref:Uncharacterized protein n=1 Tax=Thermus islandicus TaxID=540988 RepID=A0A7C2BYR8_9DEIN
MPRQGWACAGAVLALFLQGVLPPQPREKGEAGLFPGGPTLVLKEEGKPLPLSPLLPPRAEPLPLLRRKGPEDSPSPLPCPAPGPPLYLLYGRLQLEGG